MYVKTHANSGEGNHRCVIAVCDKNLLGKTLQQGDIEIKVSESFYKGELKEEAEVIVLLKDASNVNLIGKESVAAGIKAGVVEKENVIIIQGVPHAQYISA